MSKSTKSKPEVVAEVVATPEVAKPAKPVRIATPRDVFGNRVTALRSHAINLAMLAATKPLTAREIEDAASATSAGKAHEKQTGSPGVGAVRRHLDFLLERGCIVHGEINGISGYHVSPKHAAYAVSAIGAGKKTSKSKSKSK